MYQGGCDHAETNVYLLTDIYSVKVSLRNKWTLTSLQINLPKESMNQSITTPDCNLSDSDSTKF